MLAIFFWRVDIDDDSLILRLDLQRLIPVGMDHRLRPAI